MSRIRVAIADDHELVRLALESVRPEVAADAGDDNDAERFAIAALAAARGRVSRQDLWRRYIDVLARLDEAQRLARLLRAAEQALELGDGERAEELTRSALALDSQRFDVLFAHGRACQLRGDLTAAALSLTRYLESQRGPDGLVWVLDLLSEGQSVDEALRRTYGLEYRALCRRWAESLEGRSQ